MIWCRIVLHGFHFPIRYNAFDLGTGEIERRLKVFDDRVMNIVTMPQHSELFLCHSAKEASICKHLHGNSDSNKNGQLQIVKRFFKVSAIKSILSNLAIQKVAIRSNKSCTNTSATTSTSDATSLTVAVLVNDDSVYIFENVQFDAQNANDDGAAAADSAAVSIQLTKHIHPIERRDLHGRHIKNHRTSDMNNSKCSKK